MKHTIIAASLSLLFAGPALADHGHKPDAKDDIHQEHGMDHEEMGDMHGEHGMDHGAMEAGMTMPTDGAVLTEAPDHLMVHFGHAMNIQSVTLTTLTGETFDLDVSDAGKTNHLMVDLPELQADDYTVDWRATGDDGHVMSGSFAFTVE